MDRDIMSSVVFLSIVRPNNCTHASPIVPIGTNFAIFVEQNLFLSEISRFSSRTGIFGRKQNPRRKSHSIRISYHPFEVVTPLRMSTNDGQENVLTRINFYRLSCQVSVLKVSWYKCKKSDDLLVHHHLFFGVHRRPTMTMAPLPPP